MSTNPFNPRYYHNGYVCRDIDVAIEQLTAGAGPSSFLIMDVARGRSIQESPMRRLALAGVGGYIFELIEADGTVPSIYADAVPADDSIVFHHTGYYIDTPQDWEALEKAVEKLGGAASSGSVPGLLRFMYVDRHADLGHFVEYVQVEEKGRALFASVPLNRLQVAGR